jgi:hypothetical protein
MYAPYILLISGLLHGPVTSYKGFTSERECTEAVPQGLAEAYRRGELVTDVSCVAVDLNAPQHNWWVDEAHVLHPRK